jgi:hypothetical protein
MTKEETREQFCAELSALLKKWKADFDVTDEGYRQGLCLDVDIQGIYNGDGETIRPYTPFLLNRRDLSELSN